MGFFQRLAQKIPKITRRDLSDIAKTAGYQPVSYHHWGMYTRDLPRFTFLTVQGMLIDPTVRLGLAMRAAPLYSPEFAWKDGETWNPGIQADDEGVGRFVLRQLQRIWRNDLDAILSAQIWGWSAGEVTLRRVDQGIEIDRLLPRHANDVRAIVGAGKLIGVRVLRCVNRGLGHIDLEFPKTWWHAFQPECGRFYGESVLLGCYSPWWDKWMDGGAIDVRRLFMHKDAYAGADLTYPEGMTNIPGKGEVPNRDIARELVEQIVAGGVTARPAQFDLNGNEVWKLTRATVSSNPGHILQYPHDLDTEILRGLEVPDDVLSSDGTGAWAGKRVPMGAFYAGLDRWLQAVIRDLDEQVIRPLVALNFPPDKADYEIQTKPLAEQAMEQQGNAGQGQQQDQPGQQPPGGGPDDMFGGQDDWGGGPDQDPWSRGPDGQRMSLAAVGAGEVSPHRLVSAARRILATRMATQRTLWSDDEEEDAWVRYQGPHGGTGWRNQSTGEIRYQDDRPGGAGKPDKTEVKPAEFESKGGKQGTFWRGLKDNLPGQRDFIEEQDSKEKDTPEPEGKPAGATPAGQKTDDKQPPEPAQKKGPNGLTKQEAIAKAMGDSKRKMMSYDQACAATFHYQGTSANDWEAVPVKGFATTDDGAGNQVSMPEFDFPAGYQSAPVVHESGAGPDGGVCGLCGHNIKNTYWLQHHGKGWTMPVGSECVTQFAEGASGAKLVKDAKKQMDRDFVGEAQKALKDLRTWYAVVHKNYAGGNVLDVVRKIDDKETLTAAWRLIKSLGYDASGYRTRDWMHLTEDEAKAGGQGYGSKGGEVATDRKVANWVKKYGDDARKQIDAIQDYFKKTGYTGHLEEPEPDFINVGTGEKARAVHAMLDRPYMLKADSLGVLYDTVHHSQHDALTKAIAKRVPELAAHAAKVQEESKPKAPGEAPKAGDGLSGNHKEFYAEVAPAMQRQIAKETTPRRKAQVAIGFMGDEAPAVQKALADRLRELDPEAYDYAAAGKMDIPIGLRKHFQKDTADTTPPEAAPAAAPDPVTVAAMKGVRSGTKTEAHIHDRLATGELAYDRDSDTWAIGPYTGKTAGETIRGWVNGGKRKTLKEERDEIAEQFEHMQREWKRSGKEQPEADRARWQKRLDTLDEHLRKTGQAVQRMAAWWKGADKQAKQQAQQSQSQPKARKPMGADGTTWITIGGKKEGDKEHVGGFPVQIDGEGRIVKSGGPKGLVGKKLEDVGKYFRRSRGHKKASKAHRNLVQSQAEKWELDPKEYQRLADDVWDTQLAYYKAREKGKAEARRRLGVTAADIHRAEDAGQDVGGQHGKAFDTLGRELAKAYPDLGWGRGYEGDDDVDYAQKLWDLVREGRKDPPSRTSPEFHAAVDDYLSSLEQQYGRNDKAAPRDDEDWGAVPFSLG